MRAGDVVFIALAVALLASSACTYGEVRDATSGALLGATTVEFQVPDTTTKPEPPPGYPTARPLYPPAVETRAPLVSTRTWSATDSGANGAAGVYYFNEYAANERRDRTKSYYVPAGWVRARVKKDGYDSRVFYRNHLYSDCQFTTLQGATSAGPWPFVPALTPPLLTNVGGAPPACAEQSFQVHRTVENYVRTPDLIVDPRGLLDRKIDLCDDPDANDDGILEYCLRVSVATANVGNGHLMIRGDWNGTTATNVRQERYRRYSSGITNGIVRDPLPQAQFQYHDAPEHNHIHLQGWAQMRLRRITSACAIERLAANCPVAGAAVSPKMGFCLTNSFVYDKTLIGLRNEEVFNEQNCGGARQLFQGIKSGWEDVYSKVLPGQEIRIAGLFVGDYWLEVEVNPLNDQGQRLVIESDYNNNITRKRITLAEF